MTKKKQPKVVVEEVDTEALNAEAEDLIGGDESSTSEEVSAEDSEVHDLPDVDESPKEKRFLGYDVITKEKVYG